MGCLHTNIVHGDVVLRGLVVVAMSQVTEALVLDKSIPYLMNWLCLCS